MGLLWGFGVLLATWGCLGSWAQTRSAPLEQRGSGSRAQGAAQCFRGKPQNKGSPFFGGAPHPGRLTCVTGGRARQRWDKLACHWPVTPRILEGNRTLKEAELGQEEFPAQLQIALEVEGENLLLDLVQNWELLAGTQGLVYYLPNGTRATHRTSTERNCCYRGSVQGYMDSWANVCVCSGLSGLLVLSTDRSYILESSTEGTKAYRPQGVRQETGECRPFSLPRHRLHSQPELDHSPFHRAKREAEPQVKQAKVESYHGYVELVIVADHAEFQLDPDVNRIHIRMLEIASHMDGFYRTLGLRVAVVGREVWSHEDAVSVDGPPRAVLERFLKWRQQELLPRIPHDSAQLIMGSPFTGGLIGTATQGSICSRRSGGVSMDHSVSPLVMASTLSHQLGHNLGLDHDGPDCGCDGSSPILPPGRSCIMESPTGLTPGLSFSHCSHQRLQQILQSSRVWCLKDVPSPDRLVESRCGNYLVEPKEQCDCGLQEECLDPCCNASTCQLKPGAECATGGACCHECKLRTAGFPCREPQNECDLPEFCSGASPHCPSNLHKQDGTPCRGGEVICYGGTCPLYSSQCQELWGPGSVPVSEACTASLNSRGDLEGHCGQRANGSYIPCSQRDVLCGRLQCQGGSGNTRNQRKTASTPACPHNTPAPTDDLLDLAMVWPGTACGPSKVCLEQRCQDLSALKIPVCQCNGHGVCNNQGNCHCQPGWAPPDCLSSGAGGSVDGGSPTIEQGRGASTALVLSSLFLVLLLGVGLCWAKRVGLHKRLCQFGKGTSCQYRITHPEPGCYSHAPPERPQPPRWRQNTELQIMPSSKPAPLGATRPNPPSKPLPPDPTPKGQQALVQDRPAPPTRPLPADPIPKDTQPPGPAKPPPPRKPLPSDPPRTELCAVPNYDPRVLMLPARPAPPPPPTCSTAGFSAQVQEI